MGELLPNVALYETVLKVKKEEIVSDEGTVMAVFSPGLADGFRTS